MSVNEAKTDLCRLVARQELMLTRLATLDEGNECIREHMAVSTERQARLEVLIGKRKRDE